MKIRPITIDGDLATVTLTQGKIAIIDAAHAHLAGGHNWFFRKDGYAATNVRRADGEQRPLLLHRLISGLSNPQIPGDHENGDKLDNRRVNLRPSSHAENGQSRGADKNNTTGFKGVSLHPTGNFVAPIEANNKHKRLGSFSSAIDAARAYDAAALKLHGDFAHVNFPQAPMPRHTTAMIQAMFGLLEAV